LTTIYSAHTTSQDPKLDHLWVFYPGNRHFAFTENISALPLMEIATILRIDKTLNLHAVPISKLWEL
jgi:hypothetical protein